MARKPTILLVEQNATTQAFIVQALDGVGYRVIIAADANAGWQMAVSEQPECLMIDAVLPGRSGFELCRQIRAWDPDHHLVIILLGTRESALDRTWSLRQGADVYLPTPFSADELIQAVKSLIPSYPQRSIPASAPGQAPMQGTGGEEDPSADQEPHSVWWLLIPQRQENPNLLTAINPFSGAQTIGDKQARRLYDAIDGHATLEELALALRLNQKELIRVLRLLFAQQRLHFVRPNGQIVEGAWLFDPGLG